MQKFYSGVVKHPKLIIAVFILLFAVCFVAKSFVGVNYDIHDYLPPESASTIAIEKMKEEFEGGIPNMRIMIEDVTVSEALNYDKLFSAVDGVSDVTWLNDVADPSLPLEMIDKSVRENYYKDGNALFTLTIDDDKCIEAFETLDRNLSRHQ